MRYFIISLLAVFLLAPDMQAQDEQESFGISFSGFVKTDVMYDSRQTVNVREGHFLLYPAAEMTGADGEDLNAAPSLNILSIQTRLTGNISAPDALGAKTSGRIEGEFFGTTNSDIDGFRLRHAFVSLDWGSTSLLVGQTWHPMFVTNCFPGVVSFNTGVPFQPFSRNPQIRLTQSFGGLRLIGVAATQRDFQSFGPDPDGSPAVSSRFLRNAVLPNLHLQAQYAVGTHIFGAGVDYKQLRPRLVTLQNTVADERIGGFSFLGYANLDLSPLRVKAEATLGENLADLLQLGGYAVRAVDTESGTMEYAPLSSFSAWGEIIYGQDFQVALFGGYSENLGASENLVGTLYARGANIANVFRVSPRVQYTTGKLRLATEFEYTSADYGTPNPDNKGLVEETVSVANTRVLIAVFYFF